MDSSCANPGQGSRTYTFTYKVTSQGQLQFSKSVRSWRAVSARPGVRVRLHECVVVNGVRSTVVVA